jgi:hypothetical protein
MHQLLLDKGFESGWVLSEETLQVWENEENPTAQLKRPVQNA